MGIPFEHFLNRSWLLAMSWIAGFDWPKDIVNAGQGCAEHFALTRPSLRHEQKIIHVDVHSRNRGEVGVS